MGDASCTASVRILYGFCTPIMEGTIMGDTHLIYGGHLLLIQVRALLVGRYASGTRYLRVFS